MTIEIRSLAYHTEFVPIIAGWHFAEWGHEDPSGSPEKWALGLAKRANRDRIPLTYVAMDGEIPVGSSELVEHDMSSHMELSPWLAGIYVLPEYRRRGIGAALVTKAMDMACELGVKSLFLYTETAVGLYQKLGWSEMEKEVFHGRDVTIMRIDLA